ECGFCRESVGLVRRWDREHRLAIVPFQDQERVAAFGIPLTALAAAMHLVLPDGRVFAGADAAPELLRLLPGKRWLAWPFSLPGGPDDHERRLPRAPRARRREGREHRYRVGAVLDARADRSEDPCVDGAVGGLAERLKQLVAEHFGLPAPEFADTGEPGAVFGRGRGSRDRFERCPRAQ